MARLVGVLQTAQGTSGVGDGVTEAELRELYLTSCGHAIEDDVGPIRKLSNVVRASRKYGSVCPPW